MNWRASTQNQTNLSLWTLCSMEILEWISDVILFDARHSTQLEIISTREKCMLYLVCNYSNCNVMKLTYNKRFFLVTSHRLDAICKQPINPSFPCRLHYDSIIRGRDVNTPPLTNYIIYLTPLTCYGSHCKNWQINNI